MKKERKKKTYLLFKKKRYSELHEIVNLANRSLVKNAQVTTLFVNVNLLTSI
jgi:Trm5-related predicted tRNA methylase